MIKKNVSIEYAHIYASNKVNEEHAFSVKILKKLTDKLLEDKKTYSLVIMVDNYSFPDPSFDYKEFNKCLEIKGLSQMLFS